MVKYSDFTDMSVWKTGMLIATHVFKITDSLPRKEDYGLTSQIRRFSTSISANIAEAFGRTTSRDKKSFTITQEAQHSKRKVIYYMVKKLDILIKKQ